MGILVLVNFAFLSACASDGSYYDEDSAKAKMNETTAAASNKADTMMEEKKRLAAEEKAAMEAKRAAMEAKQAAMKEKTMQATTTAKTMTMNEDHMDDNSGFNNKVSVCKHGSQVRIISVVYNKSGSSSACEVNYEKDTGIKTLWTAKSDVNYCMERATEFVKRQEGWGWTCSALE